MSDQVSISAGFSVLTMAAFALVAAPVANAGMNIPAGAGMFAAVPAGVFCATLSLLGG